MRNFGGQSVRFCPHLSVDEGVACAACEGRQYSPSEFQQKEYCTAGRFTFCAIYMLKAYDSGAPAGQFTGNSR